MKFRSSSPRESKRCTLLTKAELELVRGGAAQAQSVSEQSETEVMNNPLYQAADTAGQNPLFDA